METMSFTSSRDFRAWLAKNHSQSDGILLRIYKKDSGLATVTYAQALDQALCFGWIDGQKKPYDKQSWLQKFTPRRPKSGWSKINTQHVERLAKAGAMTPAGLKAVEVAKADGRWKAAYDSFGNAAVPEDFLKELERNKKANAFFETLNKTNLYSIVYRLQTAKKPETREKRMQAIIEKLARGEKFH
ncbi:MAG: YdeI/OmpD-associated family protein [Rudaea sp.]|nr:YdeI/OmpD-associated family protein [Rudaea sp.]